VSARRDEAAAVLRGAGLDPEALAAGDVPAAAVREALTASAGIAVAGALAEFPSPALAALLVELASEISDRALHKELRRTLYRMGQRGVPVPAPPTPSATPAPKTAADIEGLVSAFDGRGDRFLWLIRSLPTGGALLIAGRANEPAGLGDVQALDLPRKQLRALRQRLANEAGVRLVRADWRVVDALLMEAHTRAAASERERDYARVRSRLTDAEPQPPAEPVSAHASPPTAEELGTLLSASADLLHEPEIAAWWPEREAVLPFLGEIGELRESPLVLSRTQEEERVRVVLAHAAATLYPPAAVARRLAGTAYVIAETGRPAAARQALAVAARLHERPADVGDVPLIAALVQRSVGQLLAAAEARRTEERRASLVVTPAELRARSSSRPGRTRE
jgi:hypothetical protein